MLKRVGLFLVAVVCLAGCGPASTFGIQANDHQVMVVVARCPSERVLDIRIQRNVSRRDGEVVGPTIWRIKSDKGEKLDKFVVGDAPPGFRTLVPLAAQLPREEELTVYVSTSFADGNFAVKLESLKSGRVYSYGEYETLASFLKRSDC